MPKGDKHLHESERSELLGRMSEGESVNKCLSSMGVQWAKLYRTLEHFPSFEQNYARARENQADTFADKIFDVCDKLERKTIDPHSARVIIDALKWTASKLKPKQWGDRIDVVTTHKLSMIDYLIAQQTGKSLKNVTPPAPVLESVSGEAGGG